jgi:hypothetical protein
MDSAAAAAASSCSVDQCIDNWQPILFVAMGPLWKSDGNRGKDAAGLPLPGAASSLAMSSFPLSLDRDAAVGPQSVHRFLQRC